VIHLEGSLRAILHARLEYLALPTLAELTRHLPVLLRGIDPELISDLE
jgi:hypothetical protein